MTDCGVAEVLHLNLIIGHAQAPAGLGADESEIFCSSRFFCTEEYCFGVLLILSNAPFSSLSLLKEGTSGDS